MSTCNKHFISILFLFILTVLNSSCTDSNDEYDLSIILNENSNWIADGNGSAEFLDSNEYVNISFSSNRGEGYIQDALYFGNVYFEVNTYSVENIDLNNNPSTSFITASYTTLEKDLIDSYYIIDENYANYFEITEITNDRIKGAFDIRFIKDPDIMFNHPVDPDTVQMSEGIFEVPY